MDFFCLILELNYDQKYVTNMQNKQTRKNRRGANTFFSQQVTFFILRKKKYPNVYEPIVKNIYIKHEEASTKGQAIHTESRVWLVQKCLS